LVPGAGFWATTVPFRVLENTLLTEPTAQRAFRIARFAATSVFRFTFGTTHFFAGGEGALVWNVAVAERSTSIPRRHDPVPEQAPDQPTKVEPVVASAVSVTKTPCENACVHVEPQSIPAGELTIEPAPTFATVSVFCVSKIALAKRAPVIVNVHGPVPEQPFVQPVKLEPAAGTAVSVTSLP